MWLTTRRLSEKSCHKELSSGPNSVSDKTPDEVLTLQHAVLGTWPETEKFQKYFSGLHAVCDGTNERSIGIWNGEWHDIDSQRRQTTSNRHAMRNIRRNEIVSPFVHCTNQCLWIIVSGYMPSSNILMNSNLFFTRFIVELNRDSSIVRFDFFLRGRTVMVIKKRCEMLVKNLKRIRRRSKNRWMPCPPLRWNRRTSANNMQRSKRMPHKRRYH